ncbi:MAG: xanthan lyase [Paludibacteraceae bacterium]|nr:xanthan lyase [Paludibacteraceae bacterium]
MKRLQIIATALFLSLSVGAAKQPTLPCEGLADSITRYALTQARIAAVTCTLDSLDEQTFSVKCNNKLACIPMRPETVDTLRQMSLRIVRRQHPTAQQVRIYTDGFEIGQLIPNYYALTPSPEHEHIVNSTQPLLRNTSSVSTTDKGLNGRHIALWGSHGQYYHQASNRWLWQRAPIFTTVEDLFTTGYTMPYLVPMLENAGAIVIQARERDTQNSEYIIDDTQAQTRGRWSKESSGGFAKTKSQYVDMENPFRMGGYRYAATSADSAKAPSITFATRVGQEGDYAVYVAYTTVEKSVSDVPVTVRHSGGTTTFMLNQQMGGGTWIYVGTFHFDTDHQAEVVVSAHNSKSGIVTADAVKIGGGMGSVARYGKGQKAAAARTSGFPRFMEGARYWMQYAGVPDSVYSPTEGKNDYTDDYSSRPRWVNYLSGGSAANPEEAGLGIPIDLSIAFHSDAGITPSKRIIGTLAIFTTYDNDKQTTYPAMGSRVAARDLADLVQTQLVNDVRTQWAPEWTRRQLLNASYAETRIPKVPAIILESMSHQNPADMHYGLDPRFKFDVSRAVYKGILRFIATEHHLPYVIQPLPVRQLAARIQDDQLSLTWQPTPDPLEPTATSDYYIVYTSVDGRGFDNGQRVERNAFSMTMQPNVHYRFRVVAGNDGGVSMPSPTVAACRVSDSRGMILVVDAFERVCGPESLPIDSATGGFKGFGVPDRYDVCYIGEQFNFNYADKWKSDDEPGCGASRHDYEKMVIGGNTRDYAVIHGRAWAQAEYSYCSCTADALPHLDASDYAAVDFVFGLQRTTTVGQYKTTTDFSCFTPAVRDFMSDVALLGGNVLVSGAYFMEDLLDSVPDSLSNRRFAERVLHCQLDSQTAYQTGDQIRLQTGKNDHQMTFYNTLNPHCYAAVRTQCLNSPEGKPVAQYAGHGKAAVAWAGRWKTCVVGFPIECVKSEDDRALLIATVAKFFESKE